MASREYEVLWLADWFHSFPHVTLTFKHVNSSYMPENPQYREVLYFWACVPVVWLVLTLLALIVFFGYRCCCAGSKDYKHTHVRGYTWTIAILAVLTCGIIGVSFYGNEETQKGTKTFVAAVDDVNSSLVLIKAEIYSLRRSVNNSIADIEELEIYYERYKNKFNRTVKSDLYSLSADAKSLVKGILNDVGSIDKQTSQITLSQYAAYLRDLGFYRWIATLAVLCWILLMCLILLCGIGCGSKCILMLCAGLIVITLVIGWATAGVYLGVSVGTGDFCVAPADYMKRIVRQNDKDGILKPEVLDYYLQCRRGTKNPFSTDLKEAFDAVTAANHTLVKAYTLVQENVRRARLNSWYKKTNKDLDKAQSSVQQLMASAACHSFHKNYMDVVTGTCYTAQPGMAFLLLGVSVASLLFTALIFVVAFAWRYFGKRPGYVEVDEDDPFLPRHDNASPSYYRYGSEGSLSGPARPSAPPPHHASYNRYSGAGSENVPMHRRSSPPPADPLYHTLEPNVLDQITIYRSHLPESESVDNEQTAPLNQYNTNEFYRHYNEMSSGMEDGTSMENSQI